MSEDHRAWTVGEAAGELGVSRRTLQYYDDIGLGAPISRSSAGYRLYTAEDLQLLRRVVLLRRLEVPVAAIKELLQGGGSIADLLRRHRDSLSSRLEDLTRLLQAIDRTMEAEMSDQQMSAEQMRELFGDEFDEGMASAEERWGDTDAWRESRRRTASYGPDEWQRIKADGDAVQQQLLDAFRAGLSPRHEQSIAAAEAHRQHVDRWFYPCPPAQHRALGDLYVSDPRYMAGYDESVEAEGFSAWVRDAFHAHADRHGPGGSS